VHGLVCAPARKGKTTAFVMPALCHDIGASRLVADMKGELAFQTGKLCAEKHGHRVVILNPAHKFALGNAAYNPMRIILDDLEEAREDAIADAWSMAGQLHPQAPGGDRDPFWPNGTRRILAFLIVALCALREEWEATLPRAYEVLCTNKELNKLLLEACASEQLGGEIATLAASIKATRDANPKHFESFREGAIQSLMAFGPSGRLAPSVERCDFRFRDLKREKMTIFMVCDPSRMDVFAPWIGLLVWAALKEIIREDNAVPIQLLLDEFTNYKLSGLPGMLTALGGYGVRCWMVVQELEEIARVYGREALATVLSQSDVKQFFGVASLETAQQVSRLLGEVELQGENFALGQMIDDLPGLSVAKTRLPLMTPDQVRRLPDDEQIVIVKNLRPIRALKVGYQEVGPWRSDVQPNPLHQGEFLGTVKMRLRRGKARATKAGRQLVKRVKRPLFKPLIPALAHMTPGFPMILIAGAALLVTSAGWPHLRVEYAETMGGTYSWCRYAGVPFVANGFRTGGGDCPVILWRKNGGPAR